ncbi:inorganic phosphate transporter [Halorhabdus sp. CUG00001]|uniref:inorganic phosphate transporter n=1 Tax=Halorhabdus sp. CUG00001 TaxID=2600297 RepID=UPI00131DA801|nr:inorganic phosphate transporter [Halorhabdus sp. CUG00001]
MVETLLVVGVLIACFVAYNVGGATTGPAFGPAVGAGAIGKVAAAGLMSVFFFLGAFTIGRRVVDTLGRDLLTDPGVFSLPVSIVVLFFIGGALLLGNVSGVPASTSMTAVGAIAGLGIATGNLDWGVVGGIVSWWLASPILGFWVSAVIGRYFYPRLRRLIAIDQSAGPLVVLDREGFVPRPVPGPETSRRELVGTVVLVAIGCLMAFSSGTSNIANAIAPLVGSGELDMNVAIVVGSVAVAVGTFTIARRTMETLGNDITDLPLTAAIVVAIVASSIVIGLSAATIPASFVVIATTCIVGLGWGRATRAVAFEEAVAGQESPRMSVGALAADDDEATVGDPDIEAPEQPEPEPIEAGEPERVPNAADLFDPATTGRVLFMQNVVPVLATVASAVTFEIAFAL